MKNSCAETSTLLIERLSHDLRGVGHCDGRTWFVEGALPGEQVHARILMQRSQMVDADAVAVDEPSPQRVAASCEYYGRCGGCAVQHIDHSAQIVLKQEVLLDQLQRIGNARPEIVGDALLSEPWAYRRRARLACKWDANSKELRVGLRERHSQQVVEIAHCAVLVPALQSLLVPLRQCLSRWSQPRQLGHVEMLAADNGMAMLVRLTAEPAEKDAMLLRAFSQETAVSVFLQCGEQKAANFFCGSNPLLRCDQGLDGDGIACEPGDFVQGNAAVNQLLVKAVMVAVQVDPGDKILEAFCGLGNFTFALAEKVTAITGLELNEAMLLRAQAVAEKKQRANVLWRACDLSAYKDSQPPHHCNKILLDPPRDGAQAFCRHVELKNVSRIVYVSCNPSTLARDAAILAARGFALQMVQLVDMFPQTSHIEALAVFVPATIKRKLPAGVKNSERRLRR